MANEHGAINPSDSDAAAPDPKYQPNPPGFDPLKQTTPGLKPSGYDPRDHPYAERPQKRPTLPTSAETRRPWYYTNQGAWGSCTTFGVLGAIRHALREFANNDLDLSEGFLYSELRKRDNTICINTGTSPRAAMDVCLKVGMLPESAWLYQSDGPGGSGLCRVPVQNEYDMAARLKIKEYQRVLKSLDDIKTAITNNHQVTIALTLFQNFVPDVNGLIPTPNPLSGVYGGHLMRIVDYNDTRYGGTVGIMNSWNGWGLGGTGLCYMRYADIMLPDYAGGMWDSESFIALVGSTPPPPPEQIYIDSINPTSTTVGAQGCNVQLIGRGFQPSSQIYAWVTQNNAWAIATAYESPTTIYATLPANLLDQPRTFTLLVVNQSGQQSNDMLFTVKETPPPPPPPPPDTFTKERAKQIITEEWLELRERLLDAIDKG